MASSQTIPNQPDPPVVGKVTYHSVELSWHPPPSSHESLTPGQDARLYFHQLNYCVQEENVEKGRGFVTVYEGPDLHHIFTGLSSSTEYHYRVQVSNNAGISPWSPVVSVSTTRHAITSEHLHKAVHNNDVDTVRKIIEENPIYLDVPDNSGASPLMAACKRGRKRTVDLLLTLGANPEYQNTAGKTSLMEACYHGYNECVMLLHNAGASWMTQDQSGMSALHWAVDGGNCETVELLLTEGVPVDSVSEGSVSQWTPLLKLAATNGSVSVARILIRHKADVNRRSKDRQTALMLACLTGNTELVELLLHYGADPNMKTKHNKTALDIAIAQEQEDIVMLLKEAQNKLNEH